MKAKWKMSSNRDKKKKLKLDVKRAQTQGQGMPSAPQPQEIVERTVNDSGSIIRHGAGKLETFELRESELEKIESYTWGGRYFDFAINGLTVAVTVLTSMLASDNMNEIVKGIFIFLFVTCIIAALVLFRLAHEKSKERKELFKRIRER